MRSHFLVSNLVFAFAASASPGFFLPLSPEIPREVSNLSSAVFRIVLLSNTEWRVRRDTFNATIERIRDEKPEGFVSDFIIDLIEACAREGLEECDLPAVKGHATGFLAENDRTLWTVRHNFNTELASLEADSPGSLYRCAGELPLHFILTDSENRIVFDTRRSSDQARFDFVGMPEMFGEPAAHYRTYDVAKIRLNRALPGAPLSFFESAVGPGVPVYVMGFPFKTGDRESRHGQPDSDGKSLRISTGAVVPPAVHPYSSFVLFDADAGQGMSGGPVVNGDGRVVSIFASFYRAPGSAYSAAAQGLSVGRIFDLIMRQRDSN